MYVLDNLFELDKTDDAMRILLQAQLDINEDMRAHLETELDMNEDM